MEVERYDAGGDFKRDNFGKSLDLSEGGQVLAIGADANLQSSSSSYALVFVCSDLTEIRKEIGQDFGQSSCPMRKR